MCSSFSLKALRNSLEPFSTSCFMLLRVLRTPCAEGRCSLMLRYLARCRLFSGLSKLNSTKICWGAEIRGITGLINTTEYLIDVPGRWLICARGGFFEERVEADLPSLASDPGSQAGQCRAHLSCVKVINHPWGSPDESEIV